METEIPHLILSWWHLGSARLVLLI